jgi:tetratricopeptide (TPR) repeat protein
MFELTDKEQLAFSNVIKKSKRETLVRLWKWSTHASSVNKEFLFRQVFKSEYSPEKDMLLRNEWRLLRNAYRDFLAARALEHSDEEAEHFRDYLLLKELFRREDYTAFSRELRRIKSLLDKRDDREILALVMELELKYLIGQGKLSPEVLQEIETVNAEMKQLLHKIGMQKQLYVQSVEAWSVRMRQIMHPSGNYTYDFEGLPPALEQDPEACFYALKIRSLYASSSERREILNQMISTLHEIRRRGFQKERELAVIHSNLGVEYSFVPDLDSAIEQFEQSMLYLKALPALNVHQIVFNYISVLLKAGNTNKAKALIQRYGSALEKDVMLTARFRTIHIMTHLMLGDTQQAKSLFPENTKEGNFENHVYYRVMEAILFYQRKKWDLAEREIQNLKAAIRGKDGVEHHRVFLYHFQAFMKLLQEKKIKSMDRLYAAIDIHPYLQQNILPLVWLKKEIARIKDDERS